MKAAGHITKKEYKQALKDDVYSRIQKVNNKIEKNSNSINSYFVDEVINQVMDDLQSIKGYSYTQAYNAVYSGGLNIYSTQDSDIQIDFVTKKHLNDATFIHTQLMTRINWGMDSSKS